MFGLLATLIVTSSADPGTTPPDQLAGLCQVTPSPAPVHATALSIVRGGSDSMAVNGRRRFTRAERPVGRVRDLRQAAGDSVARPRAAISAGIDEPLDLGELRKTAGVIDDEIVVGEIERSGNAGVERREHDVLVAARCDLRA